jgi:hypothetical protein
LATRSRRSIANYLSSINLVVSGAAIVAGYARYRCRWVPGRNPSLCRLPGAAYRTSRLDDYTQDNPATIVTIVATDDPGPSGVSVLTLPTIVDSLCRPVTFHRAN